VLRPSLLGLLDHHFGDLDMAVWWELVESRGDHLALDRALHVGDFLGTLVDQQHQQEHFRVVSVIALAMFCKSTVLPVRGGATISARWPLPCGLTMSIIRADLSLTVDRQYRD